MNEEEYLLTLKNELLKSENWNAITLNRQWTKNAPDSAGVYALKEGDKIVYVGETGNLRGRMNDLLDSRHHTIRRTIGKKLFSKQDGFIQATTKNKFPEIFENRLNEYITTNLKIAFLPVNLGRKELEELIEKSIEFEIKLNKRGKRKSK